MTDSQVLKRLDWPPYCVRILDNNLVAVSGGGGTSKTGVGNCIELGIVDYATSDASISLPSTAALATSFNRAQFHTIHKYEPNDAIMKFISFTHDRSKRQSKTKPPGKNGCVANSEKSSNPSTNSDKLDYDSTKNDLFLAAAVNDSIEIYKVQPTIDRLNKTNLNSSSNSNLRQRNGSLRQSNSTTQTLKPNGINHHSPSQTNETNNLKASAYLKLVHTVRLTQNDSFTNDDVFESEHSTTTTSSKKTASRKPSAKAEEETIDTLAYCNISLNDPTVYLCAGTSKGNIVIWNLYIDNLNDTNNNNDYSSTSTNTEIKSTKIRIFKEAHGKQEIDELQVNHTHSHLLSIGKDNRCVIWSLKKLVKLCELDYLSAFGSAANLRMRHARFSNQGRTLYTTCIPKTRGGKKALNSYVQKWSCEQDEGNMNYKIVSKNCVKNTILTAMQASKDGSVLCCGDYEGRVYLFDSNFCTLANFKKQHSCVVTDLAFYHDTTSSIFNPNNKLILSISIDRTLQCYTYLDTASTFNKRKSLSPFSLCSMNVFKFVFILIGLFLLFC